MAYMAVGSRQILFSDVQVPSAARDDVREVANLRDNTQVEAARPGDRPAPSREDSPATETDAASGTHVDVRA